ncbi:MAG: glycosyltransferase family 4 protein [Spirochaetia bacterium]|nr:glycosyltransferase family 4 protein [Spirochaetia bacterium]
MKKFLVLLPWTEFLDVHLVKDVGLFPEYLGNEYKIPVDFVFLDSNNGTKKENYKGMNLIKLAPKKEFSEVPRLAFQPFAFFKFFKIFTDFLKKNKTEYSHIMMFHINSTTLLFVKFIKKINPKIKIYIKADAALFKRKQWIYFYKILKKVDFISIESEELAEKAKTRFKAFSEKIAYIPNGFDDKDFNRKLFLQPKENLIIQTARFGTAPKNTQLLLNVLSKVDLKDWKVILAGTIERDFLPYLENFFSAHPKLKEKISFVGNISDREKIYELYAKAKIFILTSRWEGFSLSLMEAAFLGDYIISTDIRIAKVIQEKFKGFVADGNPNDAKNDDKIANKMATELQKCINNEGTHCIIDEQILDEIQKYFSMSNIVKDKLYEAFFLQGQS